MTRTVRRNRAKSQVTLLRKLQRASARSDWPRWEELLGEAQRLGYLSSEQATVLIAQRDVCH